jgi:hypothetical protein
MARIYFGTGDGDGEAPTAGDGVGELASASGDVTAGSFAAWDILALCNSSIRRCLCQLCPSRGRQSDPATEARGLLYSPVSFSFHLRGVANRALWLNVRGLHPAAIHGSFSFGQRFLSFI